MQPQRTCPEGAFGFGIFQPDTSEFQVLWATMERTRGR